MKRFLILLLITLSLSSGGAIGFARLAHAQTCTPACTGGDVCEYSGEDGNPNAAVCMSPTAYGGVPGSSTYTPSATDQPTNPTGASADASDPFSLAMLQIMKLFAWLLGIAAITLDNAVYFTIVIMGSYVKQLTAVGVAWRILRDIGNILLIFGFLAVGITTILNVNWYGGGKKMLPMMLIAAIFLNFSLFISEAIVDVGNLFATEFYTQINGGQPAHTAGNESISDKILGNIGLATIYEHSQTDNGFFRAGNTLLIGFMASIIFLVATFVLFTLAFILIARFVMLLFLIILSPLGFAGYIVPQLQGTAKWWWKMLSDQTITAPILLLLLYIALAVITDAQFLMGTCSATSGASQCASDAWTAFTGNPNAATVPGFAGVFLSFLVAMGLLGYVVVAAGQLKAFWTKQATQMTGKIMGGTSSFVMRNTAGRALQGAARGIRSSKLGTTEAGRHLAALADKGATGNWDIRGIAPVKAGLKSAKIDAGTAYKGGYRQSEEAATKARTDYAKTISARKLTEKDTAEIQRAEDASRGAKDTYNAAKSEHTTIAQESTRIKEMIRGLEAEKAVKGRSFDPAKEAELTKAKADLAGNETKLATAATDLEEATRNLAAATKEEADTRKRIEEPNSALARQTKYAENLENAGSTLSGKAMGAVGSAAGSLPRSLFAAGFASAAVGTGAAAIPAAAAIYAGGAHVLGVDPKANRDAALAIKKRLAGKKSDSDLKASDDNERILAAIRKAAKNAEKEEGGEKEEKKEGGEEKGK
ncbi:MAG: hypothetical protein WAN50_04780 [Minisyncoccia bacterium]